MKTYKDYMVEDDDYQKVTSKIADDLKNNGFNKNMVTVKVNNRNIDLSITVTIRRIQVKIETVEAIVKKYKNVRLDKTTGEILGGGNTYINVKYDDYIVNKAKSQIEYKVYADYLKDKKNVGKWKFGKEVPGLVDKKEMVYLHDKPNQYTFDIMCPNSSYEPTLFYHYSLNGRIYTPKDKDYIKPLWYLLYRTGQFH